MEEIIKKFESELNMTKNRDVIGDLFNDRIRDIRSAISKYDFYKEYQTKIINMQEKLKDLYKDKWLKIMDEYEDIIYEDKCICEKLMYKYGVLDGMKLIIEGTKPINIKEFLEMNKIN